MSLTKLQSQSVDTNITVAGVVTATAFYGDGSNLTGIGSASSATYASSAGIATYASSSGISSYSSSSGISSYSTSSGVSTDVIGGIASVTQLTVSGVSTLANVQISSGIVTATSGIITYYGDGSKLSNVISGVGIRTSGDVVGYGITFLDFRGAGVSTAYYNASVGIATIFFQGGGSSGAIGIGTQFPASPSNGDLFYHIDYARTFVYYNEVTLGIGSTAVWVDAAPFNEGGGLVAAKNETSFTATAGQTTFSVVYSVGYIDVYLNGVRLSPTEFTSTSGTSVVLTEAASLGDIIDIVEYTMGRGVAGDDRWGYTNVGISTLSNVGIGTTNPTSALTVSGNGNFTGIVTASSFSGSGANLTNLNIPAGFNELDAALFS